MNVPLFSVCVEVSSLEQIPFNHVDMAIKSYVLILTILNLNHPESPCKSHRLKQIIT